MFMKIPVSNIIVCNIFMNIIKKKKGMQIKICFLYCISIETNILL